MKRLIILLGALMAIFQSACSEEDVVSKMNGGSESLYSDGSGLDVALGDVNGDGVINNVDMLKIGQYSNGQTPSDFIVGAADVNCDGVIDMADANLVAGAYVGTVDGFSCRAEGFESLVDWTTTSGFSLSLTTSATQGGSGLAIDGSGWGEIVSSPLYPTAVSNKIYLDVKKSYDLMPGGWHGQLSMTLNCQSQGIYNAYLGNINLTDTYPGKFQQVEFNLDAATQSAVSAGCDELILTLQANLPPAADPLVVDNLRFAESATPGMGECKSVYENHNDAADASRYNIVFVTRGFADNTAELAALKRIIALDTTETIPNASGLMQIAPFNELQNRFNFYYVTSTVPTPITTGGAAKSEWLTQSAKCQQYLPNTVYAFLLQPNTGTNTAWVASYGRDGAGLADCRLDQNCAVGDLHGAMHEMMHSIFFLPDEYEAYPGEAPRTFDLANDTLSPLQQVFMWAGDSYADCIANSPWAHMIGDGCGDDGVIDCIDTVACPLPLAGDWSNPSNCCLPGHPDCYAEVACFEGTQYHDTNLWRPTGENLMRNHWWDGYQPDTYLSLVMQDHIIGAVMNGPDSLAE